MGADACAEARRGICAAPTEAAHAAIKPRRERVFMVVSSGHPSRSSNADGTPRASARARSEETELGRSFVQTRRVLSLANWASAASHRVASAEVIAQGQQVYADQCSACHGADLEGETDWRSPLPSGRLPAPPHDATGHTWHHPDDVLFRIVREGTAAIVGGGYESDMPGFGDVLSDAEIRAVLEYIKSTWPDRERSYQESVSAAS